MPIAIANQEFATQIRSNKTIYSRISATDAFKELEEEVRKYEEEQERKKRMQ